MKHEFSVVEFEFKSIPKFHLPRSALLISVEEFTQRVYAEQPCAITVCWSNDCMQHMYFNVRHEAEEKLKCTCI